MVDQLLLLESRGFGLTQIGVRRLAYDFALSNNIINNFNKITKTADYVGFSDATQSCHLRKPDGLYAATVMGMNKTKVKAHFGIPQQIPTKYSFKPEEIYNADETGLTEVHVPPKVIAMKDKRTTTARTGGEKGTTATVLGCANATGEYILLHLTSYLRMPRSNPACIGQRSN